MSVANWLTPNVVYGRKLFRSALQGARSGEEGFLHGKSLHLFVDESAWHALKPAVLAACIGVLGVYSRNRNRSLGRALEYGVVVGAIGFGVGLAWQSRRLTASAASGAWQKLARVRDEHWLERNPIDYA